MSPNPAMATTAAITTNPAMAADPTADSIAPDYERLRRASVAADVGGVIVGGDAPIVVQAMTDADTADDVATAIQCRQLADAGAELVRITVNTPTAARATARIRERLDAMGVAAPLVGDFHYNGHKLLTQYPECAEALAKFRINPGNVGRGDRRDSQFGRMIEIACRLDKAVRIGVNWGSLDQELLSAMMDDNARAPTPLDAAAVTRRALVRSALESAAFAMKIGLSESRLILSCKVSRAPDLIAVYRALAAQTRLPLHLGLTEAGMGIKGVAASAAACAVLLNEGIGDTIRVSLTPSPNGARSDEVRAAREILQALELRAFMPAIAACPGCGRAAGGRFRQLADEIGRFVEAQMPEWKTRHPGVENLKIAVMGCVVNGPGESRHADIGLSLPGGGERVVAPVFADGEKIAALSGADIGGQFKKILADYVNAKFPPRNGG